MTHEKLRVHNNNLNLIRLFLAILVIFSHSFQVINRSANVDTIDLGGISVNAFFVISGYLITLSWQYSKNFISFLIKRILRIYPGFVAACCISGFVFTTLVVSNANDYLYRLYNSKLEFAVGILYISPKFPDAFSNLPVPDINRSLWSIPYEFLCYLFVPVLFVVGRYICPFIPARLRFWIPGLLFLFSYIIYVLNISGRSYTIHLIIGSILPLQPSSWARFMVYFIGGMCFFLYKDIVKYNMWLLFLSAAIISVSMIFDRFFLYVIPVFGSYLLLNMAFNPKISLPRISPEYDISYGMYLYGFPVQQLLVHYYHNVLTPYSLFVLALIFTFFIACLSWFLIEKPFLNLKKLRIHPVGLIDSPIQK